MLSQKNNSCMLCVPMFATDSLRNALHSYFSPSAKCNETMYWWILFIVVVLGCTDSKDSNTYIQSNTKFRKCCEFCPGRLTYNIFFLKIKNIACLTERDKSNPQLPVCCFFLKKCGQVKEPYMETLKSLILDQEHITAVKRVCYGLIYSVIIIVIYFMLNKSVFLLHLYSIVLFTEKPIFGSVQLSFSLKYTCICWKGEYECTLHQLHVFVSRSYCFNGLSASFVTGQWLVLIIILLVLVVWYSIKNSFRRVLISIVEHFSSWRSSHHPVEHKGYL